MIRKAITTSFVLLVAVCSNAQKLKKADKAVIASLEEHIHFLADDKLQGRRAGSEGE
jgi:aminopeptidase YwaD